MTISMALVDSGKQHAVSSGTLSAGAANGQIAAAGTNVLLKVALPFDPSVWTCGKDPQGSQDQTYVNFKSLDGLVTNVELDATQFEEDATTGVPLLRLRVDVVSLPAEVEIQVETCHSVSR